MNFKTELTVLCLKDFIVLTQQNRANHTLRKEPILLHRTELTVLSRIEQIVLGRKDQIVLGRQDEIVLCRKELIEEARE